MKVITEELKSGLHESGVCFPCQLREGPTAVIKLSIVDPVSLCKAFGEARPTSKP